MTRSWKRKKQNVIILEGLKESNNGNVKDEVISLLSGIGLNAQDQIVTAFRLGSVNRQKADSKPRLINRIQLIDHDNVHIIKDENTADFISDFFVNGPTLAEALDSEWRYEGITADHHLSKIVLNTDEIMKFCKEIDIYKSSLPNLSSRILKDVFFSQIVRLQYLFEQILFSGFFSQFVENSQGDPSEKSIN